MFFGAALPPPPPQIATTTGEDLIKTESRAMMALPVVRSAETPITWHKLLLHFAHNSNVPF